MNFNFVHFISPHPLKVSRVLILNQLCLVAEVIQVVKCKLNQPLVLSLRALHLQPAKANIQVRDKDPGAVGNVIREP